MYLEIDEGYWEHPKTLDLCARLADDQADAFPPRLWKWACRCARNGQLGAITAYAFERVVRYAPADGKCFEAFLGAGFLDRDDSGEVTIHNWMLPGRTGHAIARMEAKADENRQRRADAKARYEASQKQGKDVPASSRNRTGTIPSQTRPGTDQSSDPDLPIVGSKRDPLSSNRGVLRAAAPPTGDAWEDNDLPPAGPPLERDGPVGHGVRRVGARKHAV